MSLSSRCLWITDLSEQRVLHAVGTSTALLLHRATALALNQECQYGLSSLASETLLASSQSLNETEVRQGDLSEGYVNGRSNHLVAACCPFSVFPSCCQFESVRCCVDDFLVHDLSVFHCDVEYIGFGHAVFGVFFSGAGAST